MLCESKRPPSHTTPEVEPSYTPARRLRDRRNASPQEEGGIVFDPRITTTGTLDEAFRIFTEGTTVNTTASLDWDNEAELTQSTLFTDGSCINNGRENAAAGAGIYCPSDPNLNRAIRIPPGMAQTNQTGEIIGIKEAVELAGPQTDLIIMSDSKTSIDGVTKYRKKWEDQGFLGIANSYEFKATIASLRARKAPTTLKWVKGHSGNAGNERADELAKEGAEKTTADCVNMSIDPKLHVTGIKVKHLTQSMAYKAIRRAKMKKECYKKALDRRATKANIGRAKCVSEEINGEEPTDRSLWRSLRHKDFSRKFRFFIWMTAHEGYKVGTYWDNIPTFEHRANCTSCGVPETLDHILTECDCPGQKEIWKCAQELWSTKKSDWIQPTPGSILSTGLLRLKNMEGNYLQGDSRLYRIVVSESTHLIWKLRCERVINGKQDFSTNEIRARWRKAITTRLELDCILMSGKFRKKGVTKGAIRRTWKDVLQDADNLPDNWTGEAGVLVGIRAGLG
ncbi:hypothetical protein D9757_008664 [Collybiopsis confluens]|uniref:ribonuclease H n=1 Tax=Collybiopsis confluens TaxID=2823264 RepID=A0A8H5M0P7_9AGAR|nr:hypothetical protein D9757_008664 [Collybiopsis confluens]